MIILIDGPDGSGKTTLAKKFIEKGYSYIHLDKFEDVNEGYKELIARIQRAKEENEKIVIDRAVISNLIYSHVFGGEIVDVSLALAFVLLCDKIYVCLPRDKEKHEKLYSKLKNERSELYTSMKEVYDWYNFLIQINSKIYHYDMFEDNI